MTRSGMIAYGATMLGALALGGAVVGCTQTGGVSPQAQNVLNTVVAEGQAVCGVATGPMGQFIEVALMNTLTGKALTVTGQTAEYVKDACRLVNGIPVMPPANLATIPAVAVVPPTSP